MEAPYSLLCSFSLCLSWLFSFLRLAVANSVATSAAGTLGAEDPGAKGEEKETLGCFCLASALGEMLLKPLSLWGVEGMLPQPFAAL